MSSWLSGFFKSESYPQLHSIVNNSEKINNELNELNKLENKNFDVTQIQNSYQTLKSQLEDVFGKITEKEEQEKEAQPPQPPQTGGRRTKKSKHLKHSKHSKKSRK